MTSCPVTVDEVLALLRNPMGRPWSFQGLGMLRLYVPSAHGPEMLRLHVWDLERAVERVSPIHDHPWAFRSWVISGGIFNIRYTEGLLPPDGSAANAQCRDACGAYQKVRIRCGEGSCAVSPVEIVQLHARPPEHYKAGDTYHQASHELHLSLPTPGAVTLIERHMLQADRDHATVYWKDGPWVSAEPRPATDDEVRALTELALERWDA